MNDSLEKSIICVTGKMAAGKNFICQKMEKEGWISVDADKICHEAIENVKNQIVSEFLTDSKKKGISIIENGKINRLELSKIVFSSKKNLLRQEKIVHPEITRLIKEFILENKDKNIIINATVLYKTPKLLKMCKKIIFVKAPFLKRLVRAKKRDKLNFFQILKRFYSQKGLLKKYQKFKIPIEFVMNK